MLRAPAAPYLGLILALAVTYGPTVTDLIGGIWRTDQHGHGPLVLGIALWLLGARCKQLIQQGITIKPSPRIGWSIIFVGLIFFILGRSQAILLFEVGSFIVILLGIVIILLGTAVACKLWFAFFFMLFMIPLPGALVDSITQPMKIAVSATSGQLLFWLGYPVGRAAVMLTIGPYQLLVADACAGLNSLFTLEALGLLYMNMVRHQSVFRNFLLALLIVPISFASNVCRVIALALITYYLGDQAGQGFLHMFSGMVLFVIALCLIAGVDGLLRTASRIWRTRSIKNGIGEH